jgi:hypothetical protein
MINNSKSIDTYLFQNVSNNNNNHLNQTKPNLSTTDQSNIPSAINSNCYPCNMTKNLQQSQWTGIRRGPCFQPNSRTGPISGIFSYSKPMGCNSSSGKGDTPTPLCFPIPVVYTPEMEALFSSGGIIYARKSGRNKIISNRKRISELR